jgi:uncharacterized protein
MDVENAIRSFASADHDLPRDAMRWTLDNWDDAVPGLLEALERFANGRDRSKKAANAAFFILHLAGERRETRAFAPLCRLAQEAEAAEAVLGDGITSTLKRILISTYDGNLDALKGVIEAAGTDEFARIGALEALAYLMATEHIAREEAEAYLLRLSMVALLGLEPWSDVVRQAFARGLISPMDMNDDNFQEDLILALVTLDGWCWPRGLELRGERLSGLPTAGIRRILTDPGRMADLKANNIAPLNDAIGELSGWYGFSDPAKRDQERHSIGSGGASRTSAATPQSSANRFKGIGRNDPCPCGSGKKFKKCCLQ